MLKTILICGTIIISIVLLGSFGIVWANNASDLEITMQFRMDENTREWLTANHYCVMRVTQPFNYDEPSEKPDVTFIGECEYLNYTMFDLVIK